MRKKLLVPVLCMCVALSATFSGCGSSENASSNSATTEKGHRLPDGMTRTVYELGLNAVDIIENYINGKADYDSAYKEISSISEKIASAKNEASPQDRSVSLAVSTCETTFVDIKSPVANSSTGLNHTTPVDTLKEQLASLKEALDL